MSKNDITGDEIATKGISDDYRNNYDAIFRKPDLHKVHATWSVSLDVDCPHCGDYFDITDNEPDFWDGGINPIEHRTARTTDYQVTCPKCNTEFLTDFDY